jgi:hypothetical protein
MSELKVNVISEVTGANGVVVDSVKLKDGGIVIADAGNIGSTSDVDAIAIGSDGDITLTQDLELQHDGAILSFGANDEVSLTHVHDTGLLLNSTNVIQFNDASQNIGAPSATVLDINATDEIELNATLVDINANVEISGTATTTGVHTFTAVPVFPNNTIETADIQADAITGAKIADDAINSEHYTDGSIDTAHIADDQITAAKINNDIISGTTALAAIPATTDEFLISDAGTLKRIDAQFFQNTPAFEARLASDQNLSDAANGKLAFATETFDSDGKYDNSTNYRFTPTVAGKYFIYLQAGLKSDDNTQHIEGYAKIYFNGSNVRQGYFNFSANNINQANYTVSTILDFDADDYVEAYVYINVTTGTPVCKANASTFGGFKLIGV